VYLVDFTNEKQSFVLGVKEASMKIHESLQTLADDSEGSVFSKKKARSSDVEQVGAELLDSDMEHLPNGFSVRVKQLANSQINQGKEYYETGKGLTAGSYQFRVTVNDVGYDFQYNIRKDANNREVMQGLSDFITKAKIGIVADAYSSEKGKIAMRLESTMVGTPDGRETFTLEDRSTDSSGRGIVGFYGLNNVAVMPKSAVFDLNGTEKTSLSNEFTLGRAVSVTLRQTSDTEAMIDYHPDSDVIIEGVQDFVSNYNTLIGKNITFAQKTDIEPKLLRELKNLAEPFANELESCGITFDKDGFMELDTSLAAQAIEDGDMQKLFGADSALTNRLSVKTDAVKINPMEYVDKKIVSYPDFTKPPRGYSYITSLYSGLLFNYYC
jgi:flagellar capping protein FliD